MKHGIKQTFTLTFILLICVAMESVFVSATFIKPKFFQHNNSDSLILAKYKLEIMKKIYIDNDSTTASKMNITDGAVIYSPDSTFKIFALEIENCCAVYCNPDYKSYIHFNLKKKEIIKEASFVPNTSIDILPDGKYLILEYSWGRPTGYISVECGSARVISFLNDSIITHPIKYRNKDSFWYCQEVDVAVNPYIMYNVDKKLLTYNYGNRFDYNYGIYNDTIRQGQFKYLEGKFVLQKETIKVTKRHK